MTSNDRRQTFAEHHIGRLRSRSDEVKTARRRTADNHDRVRNHDSDSDHDVEVFAASRRAKQVQTHTHTRTPVPRRQSTAQQQRASPRDEYHDKPIRDQLHTYKTQLVDTLNAQMNQADDEITQRMDELSEEFDDRLKVIEGAGGRFWAGIGEERVEIDIDEVGSRHARKEISLCQVMTDLEMLMEKKRARLEVLTAEYTHVRAESVKLAITILGEDKVSLVESASVEDNNDPKTKTTSSSLSRRTTNVLVDVDTDTDTDTTTGEQFNGQSEQVYNDTEAGFTDLQNTLDDLVARNLEENRNTLKAFQAGRKVKQGELSKLLSSWSLS